MYLYGHAIIKNNTIKISSLSDEQFMIDELFNNNITLIKNFVYIIYNLIYTTILILFLSHIFEHKH